MIPSHESSSLRRGQRVKPRRLQLPRIFHLKAAFYVALSFVAFLLGVYAMLRSTHNTSYVVVGSFLVLVLISNLLSKKFIRLLRRYGNQ